ncbi:receptor-like protein kinase FERONIA [Quercus suber]|uniref:receptor-like protein kinase FERONIA n=1 Tax=Quercus suber TaxID=58331 RepID=UPI000CE1BCE6|nr:receptor-like protein kinase FERONIA [Quercus suber]POF00086.1 receptor-like protein kinase feronia [Quercus suber]
MEGISQSISKLLRRSGKGRSDEIKQYYSSVLPEGLCRRFSHGEIKKATNNFDYNLIIGSGDFGSSVYKGFIDDRGISVAIKRLSEKSRQSVRELTNEVVLLCQLRHPNIIPLIGYCIDEDEECLVYEFMVNGHLSHHFFGTDHDPLRWKQRLVICIGVARGLHYLHTGLKHTIIHRDVKLTNILLDEKWEAKLADFGLSKMGPPSLSKALIRVESVVRGTMGYLDPEYARRQELTDKSDVYSFGMVLFELLCGRKALDPELGQEQVHLANWADRCGREGTLYEIIDPYLKGKIAPECFVIYADIAISCVRGEGKDRPAMGEVEVGLEHALQLQESADAAMEKGEYDYPIDELTCNDSPIDVLESPEMINTGVESL